MKKITIKKLTIQNWRAQNKTVYFSDNTEIRGYNKSGKSTVYNAFLWLLTGADDMDRNNYNLFDNTIEQTHETSKVATVEGIFDIDGSEYTFKRTAEIGWTRKKGSQLYERKGADTYKFYIDDIERCATEYKKTIEDLFAPMDKLKIMLNLQYFLRMDWKEMRKQLESMVGEIKISDFKGDYSDILEDLNKYTTEEIKAACKSKMKPIKANMDSLPVTIHAMQNNLPSIADIPLVEKEIKEAKEQIELIDKQLLGSSDKINEYIKKRDSELEEISNLKKEYNEAKERYDAEFHEKEIEILNKIGKIDSENEIRSSFNKRAEETVKNSQISLVYANEKLKKLNDYRQTLLKQNEAVKAMTFNDDKCPYCGQELPEEKLEKAREKFNKEKDARHKAIVADGKLNNVKIEECKNEIDQLSKIVNEGISHKELLDKRELENDLAILRANFVPFDKSIDGIEKMAKISTLTENLTVIPSTDNDALVEMKKSLLDDISNLSKQLGVKDEHEKQLQKIKEKQEELKENASELVRLEYKMSKITEYEREKAAIINERVNDKFNYVRIEMTELNKSGDIVDTCRILDEEGVNATVTNFASMIRCCMDISTAFADLYGINPPMIVDFAESICEDNYPDTDRQIIKLIVDECEFNVVNK